MGPGLGFPGAVAGVKRVAGCTAAPAVLGSLFLQAKFYLPTRLLGLNILKGFSPDTDDDTEGLLSISSGHIGAQVLPSYSPSAYA